MDIAAQGFEAEIIKDEDGGGAGVIVPPDVVKALGGTGRIKIKCTIDGQPYRGSIHPYGGVHFLGILKSIRAAIGKKPGDKIHIAMEVDTELRTVELPEDVRSALEMDDSIKAGFDKLSYNHKKEYIDWVNGAKKAETRERRIVKMLEMLAS